MAVQIPRIVVSGLRGGLGKTVVTLGLIRGWKKKGLSIAPFKKGPDFIDASWLREAAGRPCYNLDTFLIDEPTVLASFVTRAQGVDGAIVEGNRGLFDGMDIYGSHSTANLAKLLRSPLILVIDCTKTTRTAAALVLGCQQMDQGVDIKGVVLNQIAGSRHAHIVRSTIEQNCNIPILGEIPKLGDFPLQERHMGLTPPQEHRRLADALSIADKIAEKYLDLDKVWEVAGTAPDLEAQALHNDFADKGAAQSVRIGVVRDSAFQFYYPENLEALERCGAEIMEISALDDAELPHVDALYIGGGFPETHAELLSQNSSFRNSVNQAAEKGMPIYAECGGAIYLGEQVSINAKIYPMVGVFPVDFSLEKKPQGHGYTIVQADTPNPFFKTGTTIRGHEFHYSKISHWRSDQIALTFAVKRGNGFDGKRDGLCYKNVLSTYTHVHALGERRWAEALVGQAVLYRKGALSAMSC